MDRLTQTAPGHYRLEGAIGFRDLPKPAVAGARLVPAGGVVTLDLGGLAQGDSVVLALLLEWQRQAKSANYALRVIHIPEHFQALVRVSGLSRLFPDAA